MKSKISVPAPSLSCFLTFCVRQLCSKFNRRKTIISGVFLKVRPIPSWSSPVLPSLKSAFSPVWSWCRHLHGTVGTNLPAAETGRREFLATGKYELKEETSLEQVVELAGGFQPDYLTDCIVLERLSPIGRELIPVLYEKNYLGTAVRNFDVIKIYPNSSILPKYFCLDTPQNKALSLNQ